MTSTAWIVILLFLAALGDIAGTITVAISYFRGNRIAGVISGAFPSDVTSNADLQKLARQMREIARQFERRTYLTLGLGCYIIGAFAGLAAGLVAVYR